MSKVIVIGHEYGSGARNIGKAVAEQLGLKYYDSTIVHEIALESGFDEEFVKVNSEYASEKNSFLFNLNNWSMTGPTIQDQIYIAQSNIIKELAEGGDCVFVGHCSDYILRDHDNVFTVFLHGSLESRVKRVVEEYQEELKDPKKEIDNRDKKRVTYYRYYTGRKMNDLKNYHVTLDTGVVATDAVVSAIVNCVK